MKLQIILITAHVYHLNPMHSRTTHIASDSRGFKGVCECVFLCECELMDRQLQPVSLLVEQKEAS